MSLQWTEVLGRTRSSKLEEPKSAGYLIRPFPVAFAAIVALTAVPLGFRSPSLQLVYTKWNWIDIVANIALYIPFGLFAGAGMLRTIVLATLLSTSAETAQLIAPGRFPGVLDVAANVMGAFAGVGIARWIRLQGWDPCVISIRKSFGWFALLLGGLCAAALAPMPVAGGFSNWDPTFHLAFGDEVNGHRRWKGSVMEATVIPAVIQPPLIRVLADEGTGSILRHGRDLPALPIFQLHRPVDTKEETPVLEPAASAPLFEKATGAGQLSILLWIRTADARQGGPARIITYSIDAFQRNFLVGQEHRQIIFRLRTPATGLNGSKPETESAPILEPDRDTLVVATYDGRFSRLYLNGFLSGQMDLRESRLFTGLPSLGFVLFAGVFIFLGLLLIWPAPGKAWLIGVVVASMGVFWVPERTEARLFRALFPFGAGPS